MYDPELYESSNVLQKRDARLCLEEFGETIKWKKDGGRIIDIGCGDGTVTNNILKKYLSPNYKNLVGCDISEQMIKFANENNSSDNTKFIVFNIEGKLPYNLRNSFDQAVSLYALHWIVNQKYAFSNIYDLLVEGGSCWLMFLGQMPIFHVYRILSGTDKWRNWLGDVERYIGPYHDSLEPEKDIERMMEKIGFTNIKVKAKQMCFVYPTMGTFKKAMTAVNPFQIPKEMYQNYMEDMISTLKDMRCTHQDDSNGLVNIKFQYTLLIASGNKS